MSTIRSWHALGAGPFLLRMAAAGALAGAASWALVFLVRPPDVGLLGTSILRGVVVGGALGLLIHGYWWSRAST